MITRILASSALAGALVLSGAAAASAADYTGATVSATTVAAGGTFTFTSAATAVDVGTAVDADFTCGTAVTDIAGETVGADGVISFAVQVPTNVAGVCTLTVAADDGVDTFLESVSVTVTAVPSDAGVGGGVGIGGGAGVGAGLPSTGGADLTPALWFGAGAIALGAAAAGVVAASRRKSGASA